MENKLEIITWLAQSLSNKWEYLQYNENWDINEEKSIILRKIKAILDSDFENAWIKAYENLIVANFNNNFNTKISWIEIVDEITDSFNNNDNCTITFR